MKIILVNDYQFSLKSVKSAKDLLLHNISAQKITWDDIRSAEYVIYIGEEYSACFLKSRYHPDDVNQKAILEFFVKNRELLDPQKKAWLNMATLFYLLFKM